jgi:hypothetical protein
MFGFYSPAQVQSQRDKVQKVPHCGRRQIEGTVAYQQSSPLRESTTTEERIMGRYLLLWLLGIPLPILVLIWIFGGLH